MREWASHISRSLRSRFNPPMLVDEVLYAINRLFRFVSGDRWRIVKYFLVVQPIRADTESSMRSRETVIVSLAGPRHPMVGVFPRPPEVIQHRFAKGATCFVAVAKDEFTGFLWLAWKEYEEDEIRCIYRFTDPSRSVWDFDVHVEPRYRMSRTFVRLWQAANRYLAPQGIEWSFSRISAFNRGSLAAHARLGARKLHSALFFCFGNIQLSFFTLRPFVHFSASPRNTPIICLDVCRPANVDTA